jgi:hypothetical protein
MSNLSATALGRVDPVAPTAKAIALRDDRIRERETSDPHRKPDLFL